MSRTPSTAGIAIGPILFVIALLGVLAMVASSNMGSFGTASTADRVTADIGSQANLIRSKISECYMQFLAGGTNNAASPCEGDAYPCSDQTSGTLVKNLTCPGDPLVSGSQQNLWTGARNALLPPPTAGFSEWMYMNAGNAGGRCFWTAPSSGKNNSGIVAGLTKAATKFSSQELTYSASGNTQKFVIFITPPTGTAHARCTSTLP